MADERTKDAAALIHAIRRYIEAREGGRTDLSIEGFNIDPWMDLPWTNTEAQHLHALRLAEAAPEWGILSERAVALWGPRAMESYDWVQAEYQLSVNPT